MNGAIKELEELFSTKAKGNTVYFNDVCYTPLPLPVQNAVKLIMDEYPDLRYRMGLYSVTVFDKGQSIESSCKLIKSDLDFVNKGDKTIVKKNGRIVAFIGERPHGGFYYAFGKPSASHYMSFDVDDYETAVSRIKEFAEDKEGVFSSSRKIVSRVTSEGSYAVEVDGTIAAMDYPKNIEQPEEFESEQQAKNSKLYKRLMERYGEDHVKVIKESRSISSKSSRKSIKSSKNDSGRYKIYYNTNKSAASRGFYSDDDSEEKLFNSIDEIAIWMRDKGIGYHLCDDDGNLLSDLTLDNLVEAANDADLSGGDPVIFLFEDSDTGKVKYTDWNPEDFKFDEMDDDEDDDIYSSHRARKIKSRSISSSGAFRDRDEDDNPECIIEILKDGKWEGVGIDKNADDGWSTDVNFTVFESEDKARKSGMAKRVKNAGYSEEDGTLKFSTK